MRIILSLVLAIIITSIPVHSIRAQSLSLQEIVEIFIKLGVITPEKATAARAIVSPSTTVSTPVTQNKTRLTLILPNTEGVFFELGREMLIRWDSQNIEKVHVDIVSTAGISYRIASNVPASQGKTFSWIIPSSISTGTYRIRISSGEFSDESEMYFNVVPSTANPDHLSAYIRIPSKPDALLKSGSSPVNLDLATIVDGGSGNYMVSWTFDDPLTPHIDSSIRESRFSTLTERKTVHSFNKAGQWDISVTVSDDYGRKATATQTIIIEQGL